MEKEQKPIDICIPRMENSIKRDQIFRTLQKLKIGYIERITEIPLKKEDGYKRVIIKIKWNNTEQSKTIQTRLKNEEPVNIVYDMPWFWRLLVSNR
jgi:hypothetical protein